MLPPVRCFLIKSYTPYASLEAMDTDIGFALRQRHLIVSEHQHSNFPNFDLFKHQFAQVSKHDGRRFVIDSNLAHNYATEGQSLYDHWKLPRFSFLTDNPVHKLDLLQGFPQRGLIGVVDLDFLEILEKFSYPGKGAIPFPHGGPPPLPQLPESRERDIDVLMVGNVSTPLATADWLDKCGGQDPRIRDAFATVLDRARNTDESLWRITDSEFTGRGIIAPPEKLAAVVRETEGQLIAQRRRDILASVKTQKVVYYGAIEDGGSIAASDNVTVRDILPFYDVCDLMMRAKIVVNVSPSFRNGAHERVFYGLSRGAQILAEPTRFLTKEVEQDLGVSFMPFDAAGMDDAIAAVLDRSAEERDAVRERATAHYAATHTWGQRVDVMLDAMAEKFWPDEAGD